MITPVLRIKDDPHLRTPHTIQTQHCSCTAQFQYAYVFVSCVQRGVVEGSGVGSGGCVVHFDVHGE